MFTTVSDVLSHAFLQNALIIGIPLALCSAILGVTLVLKRYSMIGDGLSHVSFGASSVAVALGLAPLGVAIPVAIVTAFLMLKISNSSRIKGDSAIAIISATSISIGIIAVSLKEGTNVDISGYMFGSILAINEDCLSLPATIAVFLVLIATYVLLYTRIFAITFDEQFSRATGMNTGALNSVMSIMVAVVIVIGMKMIGAVLISSLTVFPAVGAMKAFKSYKGVVIGSSCVSVVCFSTGIFLSCVIDNLPAGAAIVIMNAAVFLVLCLFGTLMNRSSNEKKQ